MTGFLTKAIHGPNPLGDPHGTLRAPVYDNVAFGFENAADMQSAFQGHRALHSYSRISNPTVADFETRVAHLAGARGALAVASGMAAISNTILTLAEAGSNIVTTHWLFGNTISLFEQTLGPWGLSVRYADFSNPASVAAAIDDKTRAVFFETVTNPQLEVADAESISAVAHARSVPLVADGTATTPYLFLSKDYGVDIEVISSTKYISGGATAIGGVIIDNGAFDWRRHPKLQATAKRFGPNAFLMALRREVYRNLGACMAPHTAFLHALGLETLPLRVDKSCANTLVLAQWLQRRPEVRGVNYPGLETSPWHETAKQQFASRYGGILTFDLADKEQCFALLDAFRLIARATNIHDNKTLAIHPASTLFCDYTDEERAKMGVSNATIRLSVGCEDAADLVADFDQAFSSIEVGR